MSTLVHNDKNSGKTQSDKFVADQLNGNSNSISLFKETHLIKPSDLKSISLLRIDYKQIYISFVIEGDLNDFFTQENHSGQV